MALTDLTENVSSRHWLRMPAPDAGANHELFIFSGIAIFDTLRGTDGAWDRGPAFIQADYTNVISPHRAILPRHWTVTIQPASIFHANGTTHLGLAVDNFSLLFDMNAMDGTEVAVAGGLLRLRAEIALQGGDVSMRRLAYHAMILGTLVAYRPAGDPAQTP
jgi:hypothetical protein